MFHLPCLLPAVTLIQKTTQASINLSSPSRGQSASGWWSKATHAPLRRHLLLREVTGRLNLVVSSSLVSSSLSHHRSGTNLRRCTLGHATWKPCMGLGPRTRHEPLSRPLLTGVVCTMLTCRYRYRSRLATRKDARQRLLLTPWISNPSKSHSRINTSCLSTHLLFMVVSWS
jgi:hypothetical protein